MVRDAVKAERMDVKHKDGAMFALHKDAEFHHHHSHTHGSTHVDGHHLLNVNHLSIGFKMYDPTEGFWRARQIMTWVIRDLTVSVHKGEVLAIVGASGSGKTLLADSIMGMFAPNSEVRGDIFFDGEKQDAQSLKALRGRRIAYIPQSINALDPLMKVGAQIGGDKSRRQELFERYRLSREVERMYPHELSGGMARRVFLCMGLMSRPELVVADEPTPGLDLPLAMRAMEDFRALADEGASVLLITHDIELALRVADRVAVFKDGTIVEETSVANFSDPGLLRDGFSKQLYFALPENGFEISDHTGKEPYA